MNETNSEPMCDTQGYLTPEQFEHLISYAKRSRDMVLFRFFFGTGRRVSEVVRAIKPEDFNFRDSMVRFKIEKRKRLSPIWINVNREVMDMMKDYIAATGIGPEDYIFPINRFRVDQIIKDMGLRAGMEYVGKHKIHVHMLRHSFAIAMAKLTKDMNEMKKLQALMGHANINSTSYYLDHFNPEEMTEFVNRKDDKNE